jgi:S-adenosylmethionine hydrolase
VKLSVNGRVIETFRLFFGDENGSQEEIFAIWGSAGFLELAVNGGSAAQVLKAKPGDAVIVSA